MIETSQFLISREFFRSYNAAILENFFLFLDEEKNLFKLKKYIFFRMNSMTIVRNLIQMTMKDDESSGRPRNVVNEEKAEIVREFIRKEPKSSWNRNEEYPQRRFIVF